MAHPRTRNSHPKNSHLNKLLAIGAGLLGVGLFLDVRGLPSFGIKDPIAECQKVVQPKAVLSGSQLIRLLDVEKGAPKEKMREILREPYCKLPNFEVRAGSMAEREAYLVAADDFVQFDPRTRVVILYEGDQYAGYRFWVR